MMFNTFQICAILGAKTATNYLLNWLWQWMIRNS